VRQLLFPDIPAAEGRERVQNAIAGAADTDRWERIERIAADEPEMLRDLIEELRATSAAELDDRDRAMVRDMPEDDVYRVMLVHADGREVNAFFLYRGQRPDPGQEIDVENELNPDDRRRARVTQITRDHEPAMQGSLIHATEF